MSTRIGTSYFVSHERAYQYYGQYDPYLAPELLRKYVDRKIETGEISIGKPPSSVGKIAGINSEGRYEIAL